MSSVPGDRVALAARVEDDPRAGEARLAEGPARAARAITSVTCLAAGETLVDAGTV